MSGDTETIDQTRLAIQTERARYASNRYQWAMSDGPQRLFDVLDALTIRVGALEEAAKADAAA